MVFRKQVAMPSVANKKRCRPAHNNDQVSPQPRRMASQMSSAPHVAGTAKATKAPAMRVSTPGLPGRKRLCTHEDDGNWKADPTTDNDTLRLQVQLSGNEVDSNDVLERLQLQKWEEKCPDLLSQHGLMVKLQKWEKKGHALLGRCNLMVSKHCGKVERWWSLMVSEHMGQVRRRWQQWASNVCGPVWFARRMRELQWALRKAQVKTRREWNPTPRRTPAKKVKPMTSGSDRNLRSVSERE